MVSPSTGIRRENLVRYPDLLDLDEDGPAIVLQAQAAPKQYLLVELEHGDANVFEHRGAGQVVESDHVTEQ